MLQTILNFIGIAVFAASGAVVGVRKGFDLFGIAVMNGVVLVSQIRKLQEQARAGAASTREAADTCCSTSAHRTPSSTGRTSPSRSPRP